MNRIRILYFLSVFLVLPVLLNAQGGRAFVVNHFVSDPNVIESHVVITDVEGKGPIVTMKFYDNDGNLVGEGKELVQPFGKLNLDPGKYVEHAVVNGTVHISADRGNIVAEYWQFYKDPQESWKNTTAIAVSAPGFSKLVAPHFVSDRDVEAYLVLANTDGKDAVVSIQFYDDTGSLLGKARELVKANGKRILKPWEYVKHKTTGVAFIESDGGRVAGEYWQAQDSKRYQVVYPMGGIK